MKRIFFIPFIWICVIANAQNLPDENYFRENVMAKVMVYNQANDSLASLIKGARENQSPDTAILKEQRTEVVKKCFAAPHEFVKAYPSSPFCIDALNMLGEGKPGSPVEFSELERLYQSLSEDVKNGESGKEYAAQLQSWRWMQKLRIAAISSQNGISREQALDALQNVAGQQVKIKKYKPGKSTLTNDELLQKLKASTLIVSMAYHPKPGATEINPTTAYVIDESGICVTNYHVIKEYSGKDIYVSLTVMTADGRSYPVTKILSSSKTDDLAIFLVDTKGDKLPALPLGVPAVEGSTVNVLSHASRNFYTLTTGEVSGYKSDSLFGAPCRVMNVTAEYSIGSSGGPITDVYGNVIGTVSRYTNNPGGGTTKKAIPVSELKELIAQ